MRVYVVDVEGDPVQQFVLDLLGDQVEVRRHPCDDRWCLRCRSVETVPVGDAL